MFIREYNSKWKGPRGDVWLDDQSQKADLLRVPFIAVNRVVVRMSHQKWTSTYNCWRRCLSQSDRPILTEIKVSGDLDSKNIVGDVWSVSIG